MKYLSIYTILAGASVIYSVVGLYFVIKVWIRWNAMDTDVIKARVFLNKKFIERNWLYVFLAGASLTSHQLIKFLTSENYITNIWIIELSYIIEFMVLVLLVMLAYEWYTILYIKK